MTGHVHVLLSDNNAYKTSWDKLLQIIIARYQINCLDSFLVNQLFTDDVTAVQRVIIALGQHGTLLWYLVILITYKLWIYKSAISRNGNKAWTPSSLLHKDCKFRFPRPSSYRLSRHERLIKTKLEVARSYTDQSVFWIVFMKNEQLEFLHAVHSTLRGGIHYW